MFFDCPLIEGNTPITKPAVTLSSSKVETENLKAVVTAIFSHLRNDNLLRK